MFVPSIEVMNENAHKTDSGIRAMMNTLDAISLTLEACDLHSMKPLWKIMFQFVSRGFTKILKMLYHSMFLSTSGLANTAATVRRPNGPFAFFEKTSASIGYGHFS
jgi:hypothetical protein